MKRYLFFSVLICIQLVAVFWFRAIQDFFLQTGFSWTISKLSSYLLLGVSGLLLAWQLIRVLVTTVPNNILRITLALFTGIGGFAIGFAFNPIYEGDFSSEGTTIRQSRSMFNPSIKLVMIALPDCPYCHESVDVLNKLQQRNPGLRIEIQVCTAFPEKLTGFMVEADNRILIQSAKNISELADLAHDKFPTFLLIKQGKPYYSWSNDQFGTGARDRIEREF